ncbi:hypothetical protein [Salinibaculum rarum]|uniref:hypothetical protein n=1 Tax=Salinibaculum rarum TaxID=3058903 RepID=UPI00265F652A|nr:hypothetical protein [Salinibaculum sp. KK48]
MDMAKLSDRVDVSVPTLKKHYDDRKEERKRKQRLKEVGKLPRYSVEEDPAKDDDEFDGTPIAVNPLLTCLFALVGLTRWAQRRLRRELRSMAPANESLQITPQKAAKSIGSYTLMVMLLSADLVLLGMF